MDARGSSQPSTSYGRLGVQGQLLQGDPGVTLQQELQFLKARLRVAAQHIVPAICDRSTIAVETLQQFGIVVPDWDQLRQHTPGAGLRSPQMCFSAGRSAGRNEYAAQPLRASRAHAQHLNPMPKLSRAVKSKSNGAGRQYTSKFRGVHQTFPTRRWEAQFRRNGKPTSLGCFDLEEEAARAYDKMMLWCELHNTAGVKGGITNYDPSEYDKEVSWLQSVSQDELIEALRGDGRRQAAHRMLRQKRDSGPPGRTRRSSRDHTSEHDMSEERGQYGGRTSSAAGDSMGHGMDGSHLHTSYSHDPGSESGMAEGRRMD